MTQTQHEDQQKHTNKLSGANILVIGGSSGIGYAVAELALEHGALVNVASSSPSRVQEAVEKLQNAYPSKKDNVRGFTCDLSNQLTMEAALIELFERAIKQDDNQGGLLDHVVSTAGSRLSTTGLANASIEDMVKHGEHHPWLQSLGLTANAAL